MRLALAIVPLAIAASPAFAQAPAAPAQPESVVIPPELSDPRTTDKLVDAMQALSTAFLNLPVGDVQAALDGRKATPADHRRTVRSETRMTDAELHARIAAARPMLKQGMQSLAQALPSMMQGLDQAQKSLERAAANMPDPTYPKR